MKKKTIIIYNPAETNDWHTCCSYNISIQVLIRQHPAMTGCHGDEQV